MKSVLQRIEIRNFKAFREFNLDLEGRHLLAYGRNGSGKSSLYSALFTLLRSADQRTPTVAKIFDHGDPENLLNKYEDEAIKPGHITVTLCDRSTGAHSTFSISYDTHGTRKEPYILKGNLASDFITYRYLLSFSQFTNAETFNIWPQFVREILPFCVSTSGQNPLQCWNAVKSGVANPSRSRGRGGAYNYSGFERNTTTLAGILPEMIDSISNKAQEFYDLHFSAGDPQPVTLGLGVTAKPSYDRTSKRFTPPIVEFGIQIGGRTIFRPQTFLNEAKLSQLGLSIRFAASLVNLHESDLKLLVLDDLLISLDMSNRMKVVDILLSDTFAEYQKVILTHDRGLFNEFRRVVGGSHPDWCFSRLEGDSTTTIVFRNEKTEVQKAEEYISGYNLEEAALCLRKAAENMARRWREWLEGKEIPPGKFCSLTQNLRAARNKLLSSLPIALYEKGLVNTPKEYQHLVVSTTDNDIDQNESLNDNVKTAIKADRDRLRTLLADEQLERLRQIRLIDRILECTERVLNPAAHPGDTPLYEKEIEDAVILIRELESQLSSL